MSEPLFSLPPGDPLPRAQSLDRQAERPRWTHYRTKTRKACDECVIILHENNGRGPYPRSARWCRSADAKRHYLCHEHAQAWRAEDAK